MERWRHRENHAKKTLTGGLEEGGHKSGRLLGGTGIRKQTSGEEGQGGRERTDRAIGNSKKSSYSNLLDKKEESAGGRG